MISLTEQRPIHLARFDNKDSSRVLWLPLYYPYSDMTGSTIYSYDRNRHTGTVTGATWGRQGRTFSGTNIITCGSAASLQVQGAAFSVGGWFYRTTDQLDDCLIGWDDPVGAGGFNLVIDRSQAPSGANIDLQKAKVIDQTLAYTFSLNTWYHVFAVQNYAAGAPSNVEYFVNGVSIGTAGGTNAYNAVAGGQTLNLGRWVTTTIAGTIGEVWLYSRGLLAGEVMRNYQATKFRYS